MISRWGSCQPKRNILTFNYQLIEAPMFCIEYVVTHEFTHFLYPNHSKLFYQQLSMFMPDWKDRKEVLERSSLLKEWYQYLRCLIKDNANFVAWKSLQLELFWIIKRYLTANPPWKIDALLMLYPTETLDWLSPDAQIDAHLKHQKGIFRSRAGKKRENKNSRKCLV